MFKYKIQIQLSKIGASENDDSRCFDLKCDNYFVDIYEKKKILRQGKWEDIEEKSSVKYLVNR